MIDVSIRSRRRPSSMTAAALVCSCGLFAATGCQTPPSTTAGTESPATTGAPIEDAGRAEPRVPTVASSPWLVISERPGAGGAVSADELTPFISAVERWLVIEGRLAGTTVSRSFGPTSAHDAEWRADLGDGDIQYWVRRDGGIAMTAVEATRDAALSLFDPPLGVIKGFRFGLLVKSAGPPGRDRRTADRTGNEPHLNAGMFGDVLTSKLASQSDSGNRFIKVNGVGRRHPSPFTIEHQNVERWILVDRCDGSPTRHIRLTCEHKQMEVFF